MWNGGGSWLKKLDKSPEKWERIVKGMASFISKQDKSDTVHSVTH